MRDAGAIALVADGVGVDGGVGAEGESDETGEYDGCCAAASGLPDEAVFGFGKDWEREDEEGE